MCTPAATMAVASSICLKCGTISKPGNYVKRRPILERELISGTAITTPISTSAFTSIIVRGMECLKCGTFAKSGRVSCCAPGGAWYKNCGGVANKDVDHRWFEGVEACKRKCNVEGTCGRFFIGDFYTFLVFVHLNVLTYKHQQSRRRLAAPYAPNVAPSRNLAKSVVVVKVVRGSDTAEVLVTQKLVTRGTRALRPANVSRRVIICRHIFTVTC